jgi:hypothetical protein
MERRVGRSLQSEKEGHSSPPGRELTWSERARHADSATAAVHAHTVPLSTAVLTAQARVWEFAPTVARCKHVSHDVGAARFSIINRIPVLSAPEPDAFASVCVPPFTRHTAWKV